MVKKLTEVLRSFTVTPVCTLLWSPHKLCEWILHNILTLSSTELQPAISKSQFSDSKSVTALQHTSEMFNECNLSTF